MAHVRIESDGTGQGTRVLVVNEYEARPQLLSDVVAVEWRVSGRNGKAEAVITLRGVEVSLEGDAQVFRPVTRSDNSEG